MIITAAMTIIATVNSEYPFWIDVFVLRQLKAQPVALVVVWCVPALPGKVAQLVEVCTPPKICTPIAIIMAKPIKAPASTVIDDVSINFNNNSLDI